MYFVFQAVPVLDASAPLHPVVSLSSGVPPHELLLRRQTGCRGRLPDPQPQTGAGNTSSHKGASVTLLEERLAPHSWVYIVVVAVCLIPKA